MLGCVVKGKRKIPCRMADFLGPKALSPPGVGRCCHWVGGCVTQAVQDKSAMGHKALLAKENGDQSMLGRLGKSKLNDLIPPMDAQMPQVGIKGSRFEAILGVGHGGRGHADL